LVQIANALALAGAGAFTALAAQLMQDCSEASVWVVYTQGAAGGTPTIRIAWNGMDNNAPTQAAIDLIGTVITGGLTLAAEEWVLANPGTSPYGRVLPLRVPAGAQALVVSVAESGVVGTPGTVSIWVGARA
jgi:hypothetical protein